MGTDVIWFVKSFVDCYMSRPVLEYCKTLGISRTGELDTILIDFTGPLSNDEMGEKIFIVVKYLTL